MIEFLLRCLNGFRQFEARELGTVLPQGNSCQEKKSQLWLPPPDTVAQSKILLARSTEFEKNAVGKSSHLVEILVNRLTKRIAMLDRDSQIFRKGLPCKLSQQPQGGNE